MQSTSNTTSFFFNVNAGAQIRESTDSWAGNANEDRIVECTHNGIFHPDEIMGTAVLLMAQPKDTVVEVKRSRAANDWESAHYVLDVGSVYDPGLGRFDDHQGEFTRTYPNGIKMATAGIVWEYFYNAAINNVTECAPNDKENQRIRDEVTANLIQLIDAQDHNQLQYEIGLRGTDQTIPNYSVSKVISSFNAEANGFGVAIELAANILRNEILSTWKRIQGKKVVKQALEHAHFHGSGKGQGVMVLEEFTPWQQLVAEMNSEEGIGYCVYADITGQWRVQTVKGKDGEDIRPLPESWGALQAEALQALTGVSDAVFCHKNLFICGAKSKEGALELAKLAASA